MKTSFYAELIEIIQGKFLEQRMTHNECSRNHVKTIIISVILSLPLFQWKMSLSITFIISLNYFNEVSKQVCEKINGLFNLEYPFFQK